MFKVEYRDKKNGNLWIRPGFETADEAWIFYYKCLFNNIEVDLPRCLYTNTKIDLPKKVSQ